MIAWLLLYYTARHSKLIQQALIIKKRSSIARDDIIVSFQHRVNHVFFKIYQIVCIIFVLFLNAS